MARSDGLAGDVGVLGGWAADTRKTIEEPFSRLYSWSIGAGRWSGKRPSFIEKSQWVDFKEVYHNDLVLQARIGCTMSMIQIIPDKTAMSDRVLALSAYMFIVSSTNIVHPRL